MKQDKVFLLRHVEDKNQSLGLGRINVKSFSLKEKSYLHQWYKVYSRVSKAEHSVCVGDVSVVCI